MKNPFDNFENLVDIKELKIYEWEIACWKCNKKTPRVSYSFIFKYNNEVGQIHKLDEILLQIYPFVKKSL